ncbi:MAG: DNA topoisomerase I [Nanoarchaeota archaeon]|nr:DNA topoisomerase I [Nanoarchaeota archaeon]
MNNIIILTEKPSASLKIAQALSDKKINKKLYQKVPYYEITHKKQKILILCAVGHLYNLSEKDKGKWIYPFFDYVWKESHLTQKAAEFSKKYLDAIKKLNDPKAEVYMATDKDLEGEILGYNIIKFALKRKDAKRMEFSTMTSKDLVKAFENPKKHLDFPLIDSGEARHILDFLWGMNLSRALTIAVKNAGFFKILSSGRVQGPALKILTERELEIKKFIPEPFWELEAINELILSHKKGKFFDKKEIDKIFNKIKKEKSATINSTTKKEFYQEPPNPFDLTALQLEAYKVFNISPKETLSLAQELYTSAYISYPRTSSNILPDSINYKEILQNLGKQKQYTKLVNELLSKKILKPNNGQKKDPAHPAIHPTGEIPKKLKEREGKLYDLIVKRTLATFAEKAKRETITIEADIKKEIFLTKGSKTIEEGWHSFYQPYIKLKETELPSLKKGDKIKIKKINKLEKETQPPKRYTPASIIKELESKNLGTKATRSHIVDSLYQRDYVKEKSIEVTDLGIKIIEILKKYSSEIIDENLTRHFEEEMENIREKKSKKEEIINEAKEELEKILHKFKQQESKIGKELVEALKETQNKASIVGKCPKCKDGDLRILYSKKFKSYFVACNKYPKCKTTFSLTRGLPKTTDKKCPECDYPLVQIIRKGMRPFLYCINKQCPKRLKWMEENKKKIEESQKT